MNIVELNLNLMIGQIWALFSAEAAPDVVGWLRLAEDEAWARAIPSGFVLIDGAALGAMAEHGRAGAAIFAEPFTATYSLNMFKQQKILKIHVKIVKSFAMFCFLTIASLI